MRDQIFELIEEHVRYRSGRDIAGVLRGGGLVDNSGRALGITYVAIRVHFAGLPTKRIGKPGGKP